MDLHVQESVEVGRPVDEVFAYVADPENSKEWSATIMDIRQDSPGPLQGVGDRFDVSQKFLGRTMQVPQEVVAFEPGRSYTLRTTDGPIQMTTSWACDPSTEGSRVTATFDGNAGTFFSLVGPILERAVRRQVRSDLETMRDLLESRGSAG